MSIVRRRKRVGDNVRDRSRASSASRVDDATSTEGRYVFGVAWDTPARPRVGEGDRVDIQIG